MRRRDGFTIVELLVVMAIIGILVALLLPAVQASREAARRTQCQNNLHQIGIALHHYHQNLRSLPSGWLSEEPEGEPGWGWASLLLPFMEQSNLHDLVDFKAHIDAPENAASRVYSIPIYKCPSDVSSQPLFVLTDDPNRSDPHDHSHLPIEIASANYVGNNGGTMMANPG